MATITLRVDDGIKAQAQKIYKSMGLDLSSAITMFLVQSIRVNGIPFEVLAPSTDTPADTDK